MSGPIMKKVIIVFLPVSLTIAVAAVVLNGHQPKSRAPKPPMLQSVFTTQGESSRVLRVEITNDVAALHSDTVEVRATLSTPFDIAAPIKYQWKIGENVTVESGERSGELPFLKKSEPVILVLKVKGFGQASNRHIGLEVTSSYHGRSLFGEALIASDPESTFEDTVQNVERIKANQ